MRKHKNNCIGVENQGSVYSSRNPSENQRNSAVPNTTDVETVPVMGRELPEAARGRGRSEQRLFPDPNRIFLFVMYQGLKGDNGAVDRAVGLVAGVT